MREALGIYGFLLFYPILRLLKIALAKTPETGARTTIYCAVEPSLERSSDLYFEYVSSIKEYPQKILFIYYSSCAPTRSTALCTDDTTANQLWKLSVEAVGL
jgi:hypothetical protein